MTQTDVYDKEIPNLINKLIRFLGRNELEKCLIKYQRALSSAGPIFGPYYIKNRHPWWNAFGTYFELDKTGKSIRKHLNNELVQLAADAKKISILQKDMPESVKEKYRKDFLDDTQAIDYLFEIKMASHFLAMGSMIEWYDDEKGTHPEFLVSNSDVSFNVECKRIKMDTSRKIKRKDFYRFAEKLIPQIKKMGLCGKIEIVIDDKLNSNEKDIVNLKEEVLSIVESGGLSGEHSISKGNLALSLSESSGSIINFDQLHKKVNSEKPHNAYATIFAKDVGNKPADPVTLIMQPEKLEIVLSGIRDRLKKAAKKQLKKSKPGFISCFLEDIYDLTEFAQDSGLQHMTYSLLGNEDYSHIAAISYCTEDRFLNDANIRSLSNQGLTFRNELCKFNEMANYRFLFDER